MVSHDSSHFPEFDQVIKIVNGEILSVELEINKSTIHLWKLYQFIHQSKELGLLNESLKFGHTSLQRHLLLIANLIVQVYVSEKIKKDK